MTTEGEEYWNDKRRLPNLFDQPEATQPRAASARSARSKTTSTLSASPLAAPVAPAAPRPPPAAHAPPPVAHAARPAGDDKRESQATCWCKKPVEPSLVTEYEGSLAFCTPSCRLEMIAAIAEDVITGRTDTMHQLRSLESKRTLLDTVLKRGTSDAIVRVTQYMAQTARGVFLKEVTLHESALRHYVSFLKQLGAFEEAADLLDASGNFEEAAMLRLSRVPRDLRSEEARNRLSNITGLDQLASSLVKQQLELVQLHHELEPTCRRLSDLKASHDRAENNPAGTAPPSLPEWLQLYPVPPTLMAAPLMGTLVYVVLFDQSISGKLDAAKIRMRFNISDRQFAWICVEALCMLGNYPALEQAVLQKNIFRSDKSLLPADRVSQYIYRNGGDHPQALASLGRFLKLIADGQERYNVALELDAWDVAVNAAIQLKDRDMMINLHRQTKQGGHWFTVTRQYIDTPVNKWRPL